jgi:hypothetical protein
MEMSRVYLMIGRRSNDLCSWCRGGEVVVPCERDQGWRDEGW